MNLDDIQNETKALSIDPFGDKRDVAAMLKMSIRSVDNYISEGCPVIKVSSRRCRFDLPEVKKWFKDKFGQQSRRRKDDKE